MMELSMHVLDVVENSTRAGAQRVSIAVDEDRERDDLTIVITLSLIHISEPTRPY